MSVQRPTPVKPRRVLHVLKYYRPAFTGEGVFLERSSAVMDEIAPHVEHDLLVTHTPRPEEPQAACSTLRRVTHLSGGPLPVWRRQLLMAWWFARYLHRYDTVHIRTHADWYFVSYLLARLAGRRLVLSATLDDSLPVLIGQYRPPLRFLARRGFGLFHAFIGISPKLHGESCSVAGAERCELIPCGVTIPAHAPSARARLGIAPSDLVLLFVGGLCRRKDPLFLVQAMPRILADHPTARLLLVGPELEAAEVDAIRDAAIPPGHVILTGEQRDPHPYFAAADILVFASHLEGFGTVVPEAMAHGLPVVVRRLPGVNDGFVRHGETGFLFDDAPGYLAAVLRLAGDAALRARLGQAGQRLARAEFGMRGVAARYLGVYGAASTAEDGPETGLCSDASIIDPSFHTPLLPRPGARPMLLTMVDAEEAFDWSRPFERGARDVTSMAAQFRAHRVFERHGVVPLYLADYPVVTQDAGRAPLREWLDAGHCDVGAQMHPWVTPPFEEVLGEHNSYAGHLPVALELAKARRLTEALGDAFGEAPLIWRTGRFGAGRRTADILKSLGYVADSSVVPFWPAEGMAGRPVFSAQPHWLDRERSVLEIPVSAALVGRLADGGLRHLAPRLFTPGMARLRLAGALARLGVLERIRLSPEGMTIAEAKRLTRHMLAHGHRVFVLTYHSPSLVPGNTPYVRDAAGLDRFLAWLDDFYGFFREEAGGCFGRWQDVRGVPARATVRPEPARVGV